MFRNEAHQEMSEATKDKIKCIRSIQITRKMRKVKYHFFSIIVSTKEIVPSWRRVEKCVNEEPLQMRAKNQKRTNFGHKWTSH